MKVVHVVTAFPRDEADVITPWLGRLLLGLRDAGVDVGVFAPAYRGGGAKSWQGIEIRRFRYAPALIETLTHDETVPDRLRSRPAYAALLPGYLLGGTIAAARLGIRDAPDIVHVHWPFPHAWFGAVARAASNGRTAVVSSYYSVELRWVERRLNWAVPFLRWSVETSDVVTAISTSTALALRDYTDHPVSVIPFSAAVSASELGVVGSSPPERPRDDARDHARGPEHGTLRLLFVGRLVERKGVSILIRALARVMQRLDTTLTVVGEGGMRSRLEAEAERAGVAGAVRFTGRIDEEELAALYRASDLFVLPAIVDAKGDTEGLGVVLLEALEFGLPVIASRAGGIPDIVQHGETGWLASPGDAAALASAILEAADDRQEAARRALRGKALVRDRFSPVRIVEDLIECYERAMEIRSKRNGVESFGGDASSTRRR